jgi:hypothetical protein
MLLTRHVDIMFEDLRMPTLQLKNINDLSHDQYYYNKYT